VEKGRGEMTGEDRNHMIVQGRTVQEIMDSTGGNSAGQNREGRVTERTDRKHRTRRKDRKDVTVQGQNRKDRTRRREQK
jgi:hypothetical protein